MYMKKFIYFFLFYIVSLTLANAHPGIGIVMDSKGNVYYTDLVHVWKISTSGDLSVVVRNVHTHELYMDEKDNLFGEHEWYEGEVTDTWGNYVWCFSSDGIFEKTIPDVEGFLDNNTLVRDREGNSYWSQKSGDHEILKKQTLGGESCLVTEHQFDDIRWMHFSNHDNNLYVVDHLKLKKITSSGELTIIADNLKEGNSLFGVADRHYVFGTWTDTKNNAYVAVYGAGKVKRISPKGNITTVFKSGVFWAPCGGLVTADGTHWIIEFSKRNKTRVRKISPDGKESVYEG